MVRVRYSGLFNPWTSFERGGALRMPELAVDAGEHVSSTCSGDSERKVRVWRWRGGRRIEMSRNGSRR